MVAPEGRKLLRIEARNAEVPIEKSPNGLRREHIWGLSTQHLGL